MAVPVTGSVTTIKVGPSGSPTSVAKGSKFTLSSKLNTEKQGPFFGEPDIQEVPGGFEETLKLELTVPEGTDAGQDLLITNYKAKTRTEIEAAVTKGKKVTADSNKALITELEIDTEASGTQKISVTLSGIFDITDGPTS